MIDEHDFLQSCRALWQRTAALAALGREANLAECSTLHGQLQGALENSDALLGAIIRTAGYDQAATARTRPARRQRK